MSGNKYDKDISMPSKVMTNSIFENIEIVRRPQIWTSIFISQDWDLVAKFDLNVWVRVLMLDAKHEEDCRTMSSKVIINSNFIFLFFWANVHSYSIKLNILLLLFLYPIISQQILNKTFTN